MCQDCPTPRTRARAVLRELTSWVVLPVILYAIPVGTAVGLGYIKL